LHPKKQKEKNIESWFNIPAEQQQGITKSPEVVSKPHIAPKNKARGDEKVQHTSSM